MRLILAIIALAFATAALPAGPTDQECKLDPRKEGCQRK